jgi:hypothetical protein
VYGQPPRSFDQDNKPDDACKNDVPVPVPTVPSITEEKSSAMGPYRKCGILAKGLVLDILA